MKIGIVAFDGADEFDFVAPYEIFRHGARAIAEIDVGLYGLGGRTEIRAGHGMRVGLDGPLPATLDLLVVPGGGWVGNSAHGVRAEIERRVLPDTIAARHAAGTRVAGICTGAMAIAASGILGSRPAITHRGAIEDLRATGARIVEARVVDDGDIVTCGGVTSGLDLALWLLEDAFGASVARDVARYVEYERQTDVWRSSPPASTKETV